MRGGRPLLLYTYIYIYIYIYIYFFQISNFKTLIKAAYVTGHLKNQSQAPSNKRNKTQ
ncbi:hypothetical protein Hanom_Chr06g00541741 [Helianthus anomalus]